MLIQTIRALALSAIIFLGAFCADSASAQDAPFNRIVIIIDSSGSYRSRQDEALAMANRLLNGVANRPRRHWQGSDEVRIIALDGLPETIWSGAAADLGEGAPATWVRRFGGRRDFVYCTDVRAAFDRALEELSSGRTPTKKYIFIFSDLLSEPPTTTLRNCASPRATLGADEFDYSRLSDVHIAAFWLPAEQKRAWDETFRANGLSAFRLFSDSESAAVEDVDIPPVAMRVVTEEGRRETLAKLRGLGAWLFGAAGAVAAGIVLVILLVVLGRRRGQRRRIRRPHLVSGGRRP